MPQPNPTERVTAALQREHDRARSDVERGAQELRDATDRHTRALTVLGHARAEEAALAAALAERGAPTLDEVRQAEACAFHADRARQLATLAQQLPADKAPGITLALPEPVREA